ncbi:alpha/beta hydrolase [Auritidibacter ignavus]|uniref:alpha/beta fold hydrolase n=1 Tax=Auritidibacter ignavus TaxID=678932 RepID=UPI002446A521|nr:alpha/beta hydrolase [Auritidibacter ignavus]WGH81283.1 alpha/beta hydrolase [Auritidibacter ignavus]
MTDQLKHASDEQSTPVVNTVSLTDSPAADKDVLVVGAGMGTGVRGLWQHAANHLAERFRVIGWDLPGHDTSQPHQAKVGIEDLADAVADIITTQRAEGTIGPEAKVYYAGVSISGQVGLQLGLDHGELFDGIAIVASAAKIGEQAGWQERAQLVESAGTATQVIGSVSRWFAEGFTDQHPERAESLQTVLEKADQVSFARLCEALGAFDVREALPKISVPIVAINGADDQVCSSSDAHLIADRVQHGAQATVEQAAHQIPVEQPERLAEILLENFS